MLFELVDGVEQLVSNISVGSAGSHSLEGEGVLGVVVGVGVPLGGLGVNVLSSLAQLGELLHGSLVEEVGVGLQLLGGVLNLS